MLSLPISFCCLMLYSDAMPFTPDYVTFVSPAATPPQVFAHDVFFSIWLLIAALPCYCLRYLMPCAAVIIV